MRYSTLQQLKEMSPSLRHDKLDWKQETIRKKCLCRFIDQLGIDYVKVEQLAIATACVFMHRYYRQHGLRSAQGGDRFTVATACLFLAAKVQENPKQLSDFVPFSMALREWTWSNSQVKDPRQKRLSIFAAMEKHKADKEACMKMKEKILVAERSILYTLGFDIDFDLPYLFVHSLIDKLRKSFKLEDLQSAETRRDFTQMVMKFLNDSLKTSICLQCPPKTIAGTVILIALSLQKIEIDVDKMCEVISVDRNSVTIAMGQILESYEDQGKLTNFLKVQYENGTKPEKDVISLKSQHEYTFNGHSSKRSAVSPHTEIASSADVIDADGVSKRARIYEDQTNGAPTSIVTENVVDS